MARLFDVEVSLLGARPRVWRRFWLRTDVTFDELHAAIQDACGWTNSHLYLFRDDQGEIAVSPYAEDMEAAPGDHVEVMDLVREERDRFTCEYDFGDSREHDVRIRGVVETPEPIKRRLLDGARAFPPEDSGGIPGYRRCVRFAKTGRAPAGDEELAAWLGKWDPERFDLEAARKKFDRPRPTRSTAKLEVKATPRRTDAPAPAPNAWCERLGISVPVLEEVITGRSLFGRFTISDFALFALLEAGRPMTLAEIEQRLREAGVQSDKSLERSLRASLRNAYTLLTADDLGRVAVSLDHPELDLRLFALGLRGPEGH